MPPYYLTSLKRETCHKQAADVITLPATTSSIDNRCVKEQDNEKIGDVYYDIFKDMASSLSGITTKKE